MAKISGKIGAIVSIEPGVIQPEDGGDDEKVAVVCLTKDPETRNTELVVSLDNAREALLGLLSATARNGDATAQEILDEYFAPEEPPEEPAGALQQFTVPELEAYASPEQLTADSAEPDHETAGCRGEILTVESASGGTDNTPLVVMGIDDGSDRLTDLIITQRDARYAVAQLLTTLSTHGDELATEIGERFYRK